MNRRDLVSVLVAVCAIGACSEPTNVDRSERVRIELQRSHVGIENQRTATIYFFAVERGTAARILWVGCNDPTRCEGVASRSTHVVPGQEILGWEGRGEVLVYWWELVPTAGGGFRPDSIRPVVVRR